jgi:tellurite resistance protein TerC
LSPVLPGIPYGEPFLSCQIREVPHPRALAGLLCVLLGAEAFGKSDPWRRCRAADADIRVAACSEIIARGSRETKRNRIAAYINRAGAYRSKGDLDRALADLDKVLQLNRKSSRALIDRASIYLAKGELDRAIADYTGVIEAGPKSAAAFYGRGEVYRAKNELDRAIADYDKALRLDKNLAAAYSGRAWAYQSKGELNKALADFDEALRLDPKLPSLHADRGAIYQAKGDLDRAVADYDQAIEQDPKLAVAHNNRGLAYLAKGDFDKALADFSEAVELDPRFADAFVNRANVYRAKDDLERARKDFESALKLDPEFASAKEALDQVYDLMAKRTATPALGGAKLPQSLDAARAYLNFLISALTVLWLGVPAWAWLAFIALIISLMILDLRVFHRRPHAVGFAESLTMASFYIAIGVAFGAALWLLYYSHPFPGPFDPAIKNATSDSARAWRALNLYYTGYVVEKMLSIDNIFVVSLVFAYFKVPCAFQHNVLFWGILGVIVLRAVMIGVGAALISLFNWILYIFAVFLIFTGFKMLMPNRGDQDIGDNVAVRFMRNHLPMTGQFHGEAFFVRMPDPRTGKIAILATPLFATLVTIEFVDVVFAVDSVPAIFTITQEPFIVYTSNIFAILGLRTLYFALAAMVQRFNYLKYALAIVLIFIGAKVFVGDFVFGGKVPIGLSLAVTIGLLFGGVLYSLWKTRSDEAKEARP